jgi:hypothetical protein
MEEENKSRCDVWVGDAKCRNEAKFVNPGSGMKYCKEHHDKLGGRVILSSKENIYTKLVSIKNWKGRQAAKDKPEATK